jgi:polar amino acid transport system substrate-binding protein
MEVDIRSARWWLAATILVTQFVAPAFGDGLAAIRERGELVWGADAEGGGPYVFPRDDDPTQYQGFELEIAQLIAKRLGVRARFAQGQWDKLPDLLQRGDIDIVLNGYEWKPEWSGRFGMSIPYYIYELQMLTRRNDERFCNLTDFGRSTDTPYRVGVLGGSAAESYLRKTFPDTAAPVIFDGNTDAMRATELAIDGLDATLQDLPIVTFYESRFKQLQRTDSPVAPG